MRLHLPPLSSRSLGTGCRRHHQQQQFQHLLPRSAFSGRLSSMQIARLISRAVPLIDRASVAHRRPTSRDAAACCCQQPEMKAGLRPSRARVSPAAGLLLFHRCAAAAVAIEMSNTSGDSRFGDLYLPESRQGISFQPMAGRPTGKRHGKAASGKGELAVRWSRARKLLLSRSANSSRRGCNKVGKNNIGRGYLKSIGNLSSNFTTASKPASVCHICRLWSGRHMGSTCCLDSNR